MTTALDIKSDELEQYVKVARERARTYFTVEQLAQRQQLIDQARQIAAMLKTEYGAEEVYLIGSLAHGAWFSDDTDVDLVAKGLDDRYWRSRAAVEGLVPGRKVDLIDWDMATTSLQQTVAEEGIVL